MLPCLVAIYTFGAVLLRERKSVVLMKSFEIINKQIQLTLNEVSNLVFVTLYESEFLAYPV